MTTHNFKKLVIWQESVELVIDTYKITNSFPDNEKFSLTSQLNRCAVSIPSNIAEGTSKSSAKHFNVFLENALGSSFEWETQLIIALKVGYINQETFNDLENKINRIQNMIYKFKTSIN